MADNVDITAGTGTGVATDQVTGTLEHVQLFKLAYSADGVRTLVPADANGLAVSLASVPTHAVTGPLTDGQLRATPVAVSLATAPSTPVTGTFWQATQPVSGTVTTTPPANASTNVAQLAGTAPSVNSGVKDAGTLRVVLATDQPALTNKLLVTPDSVALPANQSVNAAQLAGTTTDTNSGVKSAGTLRVVLATDQPALTNKLLVTPDSVALPANQSVNINQIAGVTPVLNTGVRAAGVLRVTVATDDLVPANVTQLGGVAIALGTGIRSTGTQRVTVATDDLVPVSGTVTVTPPTLTKGTQGATGFSVQNLLDAGRVNIMWTAEFSPIAVAEAMLSLTESRDGAAVTTFTTKVVTSGKRLRITSITMAVENTLGTNLKRAKLRLKFNTAGAVTTASPLQGTWAICVGSIVASNIVGMISLPLTEEFPDGIEYLGDGTKQIGVSLESPDWVTAAQTSKVYVTIFAFEY